MAKETLGWVDCPMCGGGATVHKIARTDALLYYRCGEVVAGVSSGCGTVQPYGASGQAWIRGHMRQAEDPVPDAVPDPVADPVQIPVADPVPDPIASDPVPARKSIFQKFTEELTNL